MNSQTKEQGSHGGIGHWWQQRLSSILLIPFTVWFLWAGTRLAGAGYESALQFFSHSFQKGMAIAMIGLIAFHAQIGIQVICEDYVYPPWLQSALIWLIRISCIVGFLLTAYALFNLPAGGMS
jgi:succinate dehydrogenase / fumarate reductase membrane anchor subunit